MIKVDVFDEQTIKGKKGNDFIEVHISRVQNPDDPRWVDDLVTLACWYKDYALGDDLCMSPEEFWNGMTMDEEWHTVKECQEMVRFGYEWINLWVYEHGGITMQASEFDPFYDRWDSSMVGWGIVNKDKLQRYVDVDDDNWREVARKVIRDEVEIYDAYLRGEVFDYEIYISDDGEHWSLAEGCSGVCGEKALEDELNVYWGEGFEEVKE